MFFIFLFIVAILFLLGILLLFITSKVYLSIKRQNRKFDMETEVFDEAMQEVKKNIKQKEQKSE